MIPPKNNFNNSMCKTMLDVGYTAKILNPNPFCAVSIISKMFLAVQAKLEEFKWIHQIYQMWLFSVYIEGISKTCAHRHNFKFQGCFVKNERKIRECIFLLMQTLWNAKEENYWHTGICRSVKPFWKNSQIWRGEYVLTFTFTPDIYYDCYMYFLK